MPDRATSNRSARTIAVLASVFVAGCSGAPILMTTSAPSFLGAAQLEESTSPPQPALAKVSARKVLSAIVFERVTGREVDPARLVDR